MTPSFVEIGTVEALDEFLTKARDGAATLFKHSNMCGVSSRAYREMSMVQTPIGLVVVQDARRVSDEIERRWQVNHETPQVLIVKDGRVVWNASHFEVKAARVEETLKEIDAAV